MLFFHEVPMNNLVKIPARRVSSLAPTLACLCLFAGIGGSLGAPVVLSIPGTVSVTIEPAEAVSGGAQWFVDGGAPQASGGVVTNVAAGSHTVEFSNLLGWLEPDAKDVLVIGGKEASVTAKYRPLPRFYFRAMPEQRVRAGTTLEFVVHTDDPGDPLNPGPGTALEMTATPPPAGAVAFEEASGRITYTPSAFDRLPFTIRFTTAQGLSGSVEVTPLNTPTIEQSVIEYDRPLPNAENREYMQISEIPHAPEPFNDATVQTFTVSISGQTLVFDANHGANLHRQYSGRPNVRELRLYADKVIIRSPLLLPQTAVTIHARELRLEADGRIETTPLPRKRLPVGAVWEDNLLAGYDGDHGHAAGSVEVMVERFYAEDSTTTRFVLRGGDGGPAGEGRDGRGEGAVGFPSEDWYKLMARAGNPICGFTEGSSAILYSEEWVGTRLEDRCGNRVTARGENAVRSGKPGNGGAGGVLHSTLNLGPFANSSGGNAGTPGQNHVGGTLTARRFVYQTTMTIVRNGEEITTVDEEDAPKAPGADALAPITSLTGTNGHFELVPEAGAWMHSFALRSIVQYARDAYLNERITETRGLLGEYREMLRAHERVVAPEEELSDEEFSEKTNLDQVQTEVGNILYRMDSNLDYFGNPAGWVPMLSFEANFLAFQNEVDQSLPILYLAYWLNNAATNLQASLAATDQARSSLETERARMNVRFNEAQAAVPRLKSEAQSLTLRIGTLQGQIAGKLTELERRAANNVADRHKVPLWKKALGVASVLADLIPVGQPTVGRIGAGLGLLAQLDTDKPIESAKALAPQAFSVMSNTNISLCFGNNATNSPGSTNNVKKSRQEQLKRLTECGKFLVSEYKQISAVFKEAQVDSKEVAAELDKLKASDIELQDITLQVTDLNTEKERFANELAAGLQLIGSFTSDLAQNFVATHELEDRIAAQLNILDHGALMHIKEMERRAHDRLVQYQYMLAKSFQYRQLRPYPGTLELTRLLTRFRQLIEANTGHLLTQAEFENLKGIFVDELREVVAQSLDNVNAPARSFPKSYRLNPDQLRQLNQKGRVVLSLKELGLIDAGDDNVRLADLRTRTLRAHPVGPVGSLALVRVNFQHAGVSRLTSAGRTFLFRHYQTEAVNPIVWNAVFDANTGQTVNSTLSAAQQSLIGVLLAQQPVPVTNLLYFSQPAADAEILVTKDVSTDNGTDFIIDDLLFEIQYDFSPTSDNLRELNVRVSDDLKPVIVVSQQDINTRQDGLGDFNRVFPTSALVTLEAPPTYGRFVFDQWLVNNQPQTTNSSAVSVLLSADAKVEARYRLAVGPALTLVTAQPGQISFRFPSEPGGNYTLEQSEHLADPTWTPVETRAGDGTTIQFTRPIGTAPTFFRVRQE